MAGNEEETVGQRLAAGTGGTVSTNKDTIKGWNDRRLSNNKVISSMVPFVQLIGIFDEKEYDKMFKLAEERLTNIVFDDNTGKSEEYNKKYPVDPEASFKDIERQLGDRFIDLFIVKSVDHGLETVPVQGIMMAEAVSQAGPEMASKIGGRELPPGDSSGGIGITDLQVDYGKSNVLGSRKFNVRMTINDPAILDERMEYTKLATFGASFLIIYGWANPEVVPGYDAAMPPPKKNPAPGPTGNNRPSMIVPIRNLGNGGYWSAARVNISNYDFGFNEMGKLEINITLRDSATLGMSSTTLSSIAKQFKGLIDSGNLDREIRDSSGNEFTLRDALHKRQEQLTKEYNEIENPTEADHATYVAEFDLAEVARARGESYVVEYGNKNVDEVANPDQHKPLATEESIRDIAAQARTPQRGYPYQNALYTYKEKFETVKCDPDDPAADLPSSDEKDKEGDATSFPTKQVVSFDKQVAYYFLGAIMDVTSLCMASSKDGIGAARVPSFFYRDISTDSKLSTGFQSKLKSVNRSSNMEERIQEAVRKGVDFGVS